MSSLRTKDKKRKAPSTGGKFKLSSSHSSNDPNRIAPKGGYPHLRTKATIRRLNLYNEKPRRDPDGKIIYHALQNTVAEPGRIAPDRRLFENSRSTDQKALEQLRDHMKSVVRNPYQVLLKHKTLPMSLLLNDANPTKAPKVDLLTVESFKDTFGPKKTRKRPKLGSFELDELAKNADDNSEKYTVDKDRNILRTIELEMKPERRADIFDKGTSKRIWGELYKVVDASDVIIQVLDARDPMGTRSRHIEEVLKKIRD